VGEFRQSDVLFYNYLLWAFAAAASAAEWFFIAAYQSRPVRRGLSAVMETSNEYQITLPVTSATMQTYQMALAQGLGGENKGAMIKV